ncbi:MAG: START domain-containing protein [Planctomycetota bacterium]|nr:START domain-containing protein [Planctomycetota bacterium]
MNLLGKRFLLTIFAVVALGSAAEAQTRWEPINQDLGITVYSKEFPGTDIIGFKGVIDIDAPPRKVLHVIVDNKHKMEWVKSLKKTVILQRVSDFEQVIYQAFKMPMVVSDRDIVIRGKVTRNKKTGWLYVKTTSETHPKAPSTIGVRAQIVRSNFTLIPISGGKKTRVILETLGDPKGWIPNWLTNSLQKDWPIESLDSLRKQVKKDYYKLFPLPPDEEELKALAKKNKKTGTRINAKDEESKDNPKKPAIKPKKPVEPRKDS